MSEPYLDANHYRVQQLVDTLQCSADQLGALQLIEKLKPKFSKDGNQWCYLYGELPNDCIIGFGDTAVQAMYDFQKNFLTAKP